MPSVGDQPPPNPNAGPAIADLVIADMVERKAIGIERYGTPLQPFNGRDSLVDLYQELLDATCYVRQRIYEEERLTIEGRLVLLLADLEGAESPEMKMVRQKVREALTLLQDYVSMVVT